MCLFYAGNFFGVVFCAFCWGFWGNWCFDVVFLWTGCGGLGGKDGLWDDGFLKWDFLQVFGIYFRGRKAVRAWREYPTLCGETAKDGAPGSTCSV
jgi:hypothetical protein